MTASAVFLLVFRDAVVGLYTDDPAVLGIALSLLAMVTIFQIADGVQIGAAAESDGAVDPTGLIGEGISLGLGRISASGPATCLMIARSASGPRTAPRLKGSRIKRAPSCSSRIRKWPGKAKPSTIQPCARAAWM